MRRALMLGLSATLSLFVTALAALPDASHDDALEAIAALMNDFAGAPGVHFRLVTPLPAYCAQQLCAEEREAARAQIQQLLDRLTQARPSIAAIVNAGRIGWEARAGSADAGVHLELDPIPPTSDPACPVKVELREPRLAGIALPLASGASISTLAGAQISVSHASTAAPPLQARLERLDATGSAPLRQAVLSTSPLDWLLPEMPLRLRVAASSISSNRMVGDAALPWPETPAGKAGCEWTFTPSAAAR